MKYRRTNKVGKFEVKKVKNKGAVSKMSFVSRSLHAPLKIFFYFLIHRGMGLTLGKRAKEEQKEDLLQEDEERIFLSVDCIAATDGKTMTRRDGP